VTANKYLLTAATLAGIAAGSVGTASLTARAGIVEQKTATSRIVMSAATLAGLTVAQIATSGCVGINADLGLTGDSGCVLSKINQIHIYRDDDSHPGKVVVVTIAGPFGGTWVAGEAE